VSDSEGLTGAPPAHQTGPIVALRAASKSYGAVRALR
jgi:hypothetical protein